MKTNPCKLFRMIRSLPKGIPEPSIFCHPDNKENDDIILVGWSVDNPNNYVFVFAEYCGNYSVSLSIEAIRDGECHILETHKRPSRKLIANKVLEYIKEK